MKRSFQKFTARLDKIELRQMIEERVLMMHVSLRDLYEGPRTTSIVSARRDVYSWLLSEGKGLNEVARLFDRAPSTVSNMTRHSAEDGSRLMVKGLHVTRSNINTYCAHCGAQPGAFCKVGRKTRKKMKTP